MDLLEDLDDDQLEKDQIYDDQDEDESPTDIAAGEPREIKRRTVKPRVPKYQKEAQKYAQQSIRNLKWLAENAKAEGVRVNANKEILMRAYGAPTSKVEVSGEIAHVSYIDTLQALNRRIKARKQPAAIEARFEEVQASAGAIAPPEPSPSDMEKFALIQATVDPAPEQVKPPISNASLKAKISVIRRRAEDEKRQAAERRAELVLKRKTKASAKASQIDEAATE
jgi:hypothetical protein